MLYQVIIKNKSNVIINNEVVEALSGIEAIKQVISGFEMVAGDSVQVNLFYED